MQYSVVVSPTYQVPVLWFTAHFVGTVKPLTIDEVYMHVVASSSHHSLRGIGVMGGISLAVRLPYFLSAATQTHMKTN